MGCLGEVADGLRLEGTRRLGARPIAGQPARYSTTHPHYSHRRALRNARIKKSCLALLRFTYGNCCEHTIYILRNGAYEYGPESCFLNARR